MEIELVASLESKTWQLPSNAAPGSIITQGEWISPVTIAFAWISTRELARMVPSKLPRDHDLIAEYLAFDFGMFSQNQDLAGDKGPLHLRVDAKHALCFERSLRTWHPARESRSIRLRRPCVPANPKPSVPPSNGFSLILS